jgi:hypothetical protein
MPAGRLLPRLTEFAPTQVTFEVVAPHQGLSVFEKHKLLPNPADHQVLGAGNGLLLSVEILEFPMPV